MAEAEAITKGVTGARSAADERRRISWWEAMSRRRCRSFCKDWKPWFLLRRFCKGVAGALSAWAALRRRRRAVAAAALATSALFSWVRWRYSLKREDEIRSTAQMLKRKVLMRQQTGNQSNSCSSLAADAKHWKRV